MNEEVKMSASKEDPPRVSLKVLLGESEMIGPSQETCSTQIMSITCVKDQKTPLEVIEMHQK